MKSTKPVFETMLRLKQLVCFSAFQSKLAAVENARVDDQAKLNQQIEKLQRENAFLKDDKQKVTGQMEALGSQLQQGQFLCMDAAVLAIEA